MNTQLGGNKIKGMTLLEVILVLAIAASIVLAGLNMFRSSEIEKNYLVLRSNVDFLFQAMKGYYQTECDLAFSSGGSVTSRGALTFNPSSVLAPVSFDLTTTQNYIASAWPRYVTVVASGATAATYFAQFNPSPDSSKNAYVCSSDTTGTPQCLNPSVITNSSIVLWQSQIVVKMKDPTQTTYYAAIAGADCVVSTFTSGTAVDCLTQRVPLGTSAAYMVWQRMPSFSSPNIQSSHWVSNPMTKAFKLQYTHDPLYEMYNPSAAPSAVYKYYYCGG